MSIPVKIAVKSVKCVLDTTEVGAEQPYVLVTGVNLKALVPSVEVTRYGPWTDVDEGETMTTIPIPAALGLDPALQDTLGIFRRPFWGLDGKPASIADPEDVIFLVSMMENDDGNYNAARTIVKGAAVSSLAASLSFSRSDRVAKLIKDINGALEIPTGIMNFDDRVGSTQELRLSKKLLNVNGHKQSKRLTFNGGGGRYEVSV